MAALFTLRHLRWYAGGRGKPGTEEGIVNASWVRSYRPDPRLFDERPAILVGDFITTDSEALALVVSSSLHKRGNVVIQRVSMLGEARSRQRRGRLSRDHLRRLEAEKAEARLVRR
jgi:hypothetical protein